jgi:hypothetical protein
MAGYAVMSIKGRGFVKSVFHFFSFKLSFFYSSILLTLSALHAIRGFRMLFALKGIWQPFAIVLKAISDPFASWY